MKVLRCLTLNIWSGEAPLADRTALIEEGIKTLAPDVVALQEVGDWPGLPNQAASLAARTGLSHVFGRAIAFKGGHEGLALLSRLPIATHGSLELPHASDQERRVLLSAALRLGDRLIWVHNTHLNYRLTHGRQREDQVRAIDAAIAARPDEPQILLGDFNARPDADEIRWMTGLTSLGGKRVLYQDAWARCHPHEPGWTWARANPYTSRLAFLQPDRRLDYIFVTPERRDGRGRILDCRIVFDQPSPTGVWTSDHYGVLADIQVLPDGDPAVASSTPVGQTRLGTPGR
jgi:endonuclease/exonuclease/phosphatase family metal-dependent hydrolase